MEVGWGKVGEGQRKNELLSLVPRDPSVVQQAHQGD